MFDLDLIGLLKNLERRLFEQLKRTWKAKGSAKISQEVRKWSLTEGV